MTKEKQLLTDILNNKYDVYAKKAEGQAKMFEDISKILNPVLPKTSVVFILTMPNVGSWNGKWTGSDNLYCITRKLSKKKIEELLGKEESNSWYYNFGDGWGANVELRLVTSKKCKEMIKKSKSNFQSYEWMVDSIIHHNEILNTNQRKELQNSQF